MKPTTTHEAREMCKLSGTLLQQIRVGPQKMWRRQFMTLQTSESGQGLCLYFYAESTGGILGAIGTTVRRKSGMKVDEDKSIPIKLKSELELEKGCEARALSPEDVGGKEN